MIYNMPYQNVSYDVLQQIVNYWDRFSPTIFWATSKNFVSNDLSNVWNLKFRYNFYIFEIKIYLQYKDNKMYFIRHLYKENVKTDMRVLYKYLRDGKHE